MNVFVLLITFGYIPNGWVCGVYKSRELAEYHKKQQSKIDRLHGYYRKYEIIQFELEKE